MALKIGIQMDHVSTIDVRNDSTFALAIEVQERGHGLFHHTPDRLQFRDGRIFASVEPMYLRDQERDYFTLGKPVIMDLSELDVLLLRQDPPFDMSYITTTYLLERIHPQTLVVNDPASVRNAPEKILVMDFPDLMPETIISGDFDAIVDFRKEFGDIILKPLYGNGGYGVFHVPETDKNFFSLLEMFNDSFHEPFVVQKYIADVRAGDKRIILIDGKPVGAINRVPAKNEARSNIHVGGRVEHGQLTRRDHEICERIGPAMQKYGFIFAGIDVIGNHITEINVTSPTGIREIQNFSGVNIASLFWDAITRRL